MEVRRLEMLPTMIEQIQALARNAASPELPYKERVSNTLTTKCERLLEFLPEDGSWLQIVELIKTSGWRKDVTYHYIDRLVRNGLAEKVGDNRNRYIRRTPAGGGL